jgi:hypothetical protein
MSGKWIFYREATLRPLRESATLARRRQGQPAAVRARADRSARRLHARWHVLERRGKRRTVVAFLPFSPEQRPDSMIRVAEPRRDVARRRRTR